MLKHQLYPLIEKYFQEYLHGFNKKQLEIAITKGELKLQYLNLRPDTINKKMDEKNIPFWMKAGLIRKLYIGCSVMNIIGEIPLELKIDGLDIILNPSYKWIIKHKDLYKKATIQSQFVGDFFNLNKKNPLDINLKRRTDDFDVSIFDQIKELFKDKTIISEILNKFYGKCYKYYIKKNIPMSIKLRNIHIRFEDDFFINYNGNLVLGIRADSIDLRFGKKGNMKKNSIKIEKLNIYWENPGKILIPSDFLFSLYIHGQLQESYYSEIQDLKFQNFNYQKNTKFIIENFNSTINFGTKIINNSKNIDIFNIKDKPCILYIQVSTNEININLWPELAIILQNFNKLKDNYKIIEKIKEYKPMTKPYISKENRNSLNKNSSFNKNKKLLIRNWFYYFLFCQKMLKFHSTKNDNPLRVEFLRFYNIYCKRADISDKLEKKKDINDDNKNNNNDNPVKIIPTDNEKNINEVKDDDKTNKKNNFDFFSLNSNDSKNNNSNGSNKNTININSYLNEQKRKQYEENIILKRINLSFITDILIKSINININSSLKNENVNYIKLKIKEIQTKIILSKEKFDLNITAKRVDFGPYNIVYGEREILSKDSYRKLYQDPQSQSDQTELLTISKNLPNYINTEFKEFKIDDNNNNQNNSIIYNGEGNDNKIRMINDALSMVDINNKKSKRSRGSSFCSACRNGYNMDNTNNYSIINNNVINNNSNKYVNNRPLNTVSNNFYSNNNLNLNNSNNNITIKNNNPHLNSRYNIIDNNTYINHNYNNLITHGKKSFIKLTIAKRSNNGSFLDNFEENPSFIQNKIIQKQRKVSDISQAVNNYNAYKLKERSMTPINSFKHFQLKMNNKNGNQPFSNKNIPLNLLEIYSNSNLRAFNLSFTKFNNAVLIDSFKIQIGTIRTNLFINYLTDCFKIFKEYNTIFDFQKEKKYVENIFSEKNIEKQKQLFEMREYFYKKINRLPDNHKTESIIKYGEYLRKKIVLMKLYNTKVEDFKLNFLFSIFNNGIKLNFGFENLECVYYNKFKKISGKFIIPSNEFEVIISIKKIIIKILGMELEINDLEDTKSILQKLKILFGDKISVAEMMIEPCYTMIKTELNKTENEEESKYLYNNNNNYYNKNKSNESKNDSIKNFTNNENNNKIYFDNNNILINSYNNNKQTNMKNINNFNDEKNDYFIDEDQK